MKIKYDFLVVLTVTKIVIHIVSIVDGIDRNLELRKLSQRRKIRVIQRMVDYNVSSRGGTLQDEKFYRWGRNVRSGYGVLRSWETTPFLFRY